jgi:hypothetical protein
MMGAVLRVVLLTCLVLILALATHLALGAERWVVAPGPLKLVCEPQQREPELRLGPTGIEWVQYAPKCQHLKTGLAPTYHLDGQRMVPSQQTVPEGAACIRTMTLDKHTYGLTVEGGTLWALCSSR